MDTLNDAKRRRLSVFAAQSQGHHGKEIEAQQQLVQLEAAVKTMLSSDALSRFGAIKAAHPETAAQVVMLITQLAQRGQLHSMVDDVLMKRILSELHVERDIKIVRK